MSWAGVYMHPCSGRALVGEAHYFRNMGLTAANAPVTHTQTNELTPRQQGVL